MGRLGWSWVASIGIPAVALFADTRTDFEYILFQRSGGVIAGIAIIVAILKFRHWRPTGKETVADRIYRGMGQPTPVENATRRFEARKALSAIALALLGTAIATFGDVAKSVLLPGAPAASETNAIEPVVARSNAG